MAAPGYEPQRTNVMAIACLVVAVLSLLTCGGLVIGPLLGLVLGALALVQINGSNGRETGSALAATGLALSVASFLMMIVAAAVLLPVFSQARETARQAAGAPTSAPASPVEQGEVAAAEQARQESCEANVKQLAIAALMYAQDYDERLPREGASWAAVFEPYVRVETVFQCPSDEAPPSYEFRAELLGQTLTSRPNPADDIMLFETDDQQTIAWRHQGGAEFAYLDGHAKWLSEANNPMATATR